MGTRSSMTMITKVGPVYKLVPLRGRSLKFVEDGGNYKPTDPPSLKIELVTNLPNNDVTPNIVGPNPSHRTPLSH